jgi:cytochrome c oxidase assembly factor CtaG
MRGAAAVAAGALLAAAPVGKALAHGAERGIASGAGWQIAVAVPLFLAGGLYCRGLHRAWRRAGPGRGVRRNEALAFGAGLVVLAVMLALPLHVLGRLHFAPHMLEHGLLTLVAAPLLAAGRPGLPYLLGLPWPWRARVGRFFANERVRRCWRKLVHPGVAWALHGGALWLWHAPLLFEAALESEAVHYLQHLTLLATALLFWASLLPRRADTKSRIVAVFSLFTTSIHATLLGALLTLSPTVWYARYAGAEGPGGLSALEDQQLAGLIMWVPFGVVYVAAALALLAAVLRDDCATPRRRRGLLATAG